MNQKSRTPRTYEEAKAYRNAMDKEREDAAKRRALRNPKKKVPQAQALPANCKRVALLFVPASLHSNDNPKLHLFITSDGREMRLGLGKIMNNLTEALEVIRKPLPADPAWQTVARMRKHNARTCGLAFFEAVQDAGAENADHLKKETRYFRKLQLARLKQLKAKL